jgi:hypothetical protein
MAKAMDFSFKGGREGGRSLSSDNVAVPFKLKIQGHSPSNCIHFNPTSVLVFTTSRDVPAWIPKFILAERSFTALSIIKT